jgi:hypothetical protein
VPGAGRHNASVGRGQGRITPIVSQPTYGARNTYGHNPPNFLAFRSSAPQGQSSTHPNQFEQTPSLSGVASLNLHRRHAAPPSGLSFSPTAPRHPIPPAARRGAGPRGSSDIISNVPTNNGELMDESYEVQKSAFFVVGRIFAILWHTNIGPSSQSQGKQCQGNDVRSGTTHIGRFNVQISSHIQRMAVVNREHGYCWCIPVNTYNGKGVAKKGFNESDRAAHSIIYMKGEDPFQADDEFDIIKEAIAVIPANREQKLDRMSRLNFGKVHTVEHNVRVMPVGRVAQQSLPYFEGYWAAKAKESCEKNW